MARRPKRNAKAVSPQNSHPRMVEKANSTIPRETSSPPRGPSTVLKARAVRATPFTCAPEASAVPSTPEAQMHRPVTVQITVVSKNTPVMFT